MQRDEVNIGSIVTVKGYGGFATVLAIEELPYCGMYGQPIYRVTVKWGPYNNITGRVKYSPVEEFPLGRLEAAVQPSEEQMQDSIDAMDQAQLLARLAQINAQLQEV
jgi:hypothetical protein